MASRASEQMFAPRCRAGLGSYWPEMLAAAVLVECLCAWAAAAHFGVADQIPWGVYYVLWLVPAAAACSITFALWMYQLLRAKEERPLQATLEKLRSLDRRSYIEIIVPIVAMAPFMASFTTFKTLMQNIAPGTIDITLSQIDGVFGVQPWQLTHALFGPLATVLLDKIYFVWFAVSQLTLISVLFVPQLRRQRGQVLLTFVISWLVLGVLMATLMPSVGPCYYGKVYQPDVYAGLMTRLRSIDGNHPLHELLLQHRLWADHSREIIAVGSGVSAMPSMHVSVATVTALLLRRIGLAWLGTLWLAAIWVGSVHLGWHYAIDGLVAILGTIAIWKAISVLMGRRQDSTNASPQKRANAGWNWIGA